MKLYYSHECEQYHRRARVKIEWFDTLDLGDRMLVSVDEPKYARGDCPHDWEVLIDIESKHPERYCNWCDETQEGRVVF